MILNEFNNQSNPRDTATVDVPLLIRLLEYAREDAKNDMDLHDVTERIIALSAEGKTLSMDDYDAIVDGSVNEDSDPMNPTVGNYDLNTLQKKVARDFAQMAETAATAKSRREWNNIMHQLSNNTMYQLEDILDTYETLRARYSKGGPNSRGIDKDRVSEKKMFKRK